MRRTLIWTDRLVLLLVAAGLTLGGLALLDWHYRLVLDGWSDTFVTGRAVALTETGWWPWASAAAGVVLGVLGVLWLLAHLRRDRPGDLRLSGSTVSGLLEVDLASVADAAARRFAELAPVSAARGTTGRIGARAVVEIQAHLEPDADTETLTAAARECAREVAQAFPEGEATCRVLLSAPRRRRRPTQQVRLQ